jgi:hypothetical protein
LHSNFHQINIQGVSGFKVSIAGSDATGNTEPEMPYKYCAICMEIFHQINIQDVSGFKVSIAGSDATGNTEPEMPY